MTPFIRTDADGLIMAASDKKGADLSGFMQSLRNGTIAASAEIANHPNGTGTYSLGSERGDFISVNLVAGQTYAFSQRGTPTNGIEDPYLFLVDTTGTTVLAQDDDGGFGRSALITYTATVSGTHYLYASSWYHLDPSAPGYPTADTGDYTISAWIAKPEHDAPSTLAGAVEMGEGTTFGHIETASDQDVYAVQVTAGQVYTFSFSGGVSGPADFDLEPGETIAYLDLISANGTILGSSLNYESSLSYYAEESGTIYLRTESFLGTTGGYTLDVQAQALSELDPLDTLDWVEANDVRFVEVDGVKTAYVYFGDSDENFNQTADDGGPMVTIDWNDYEKGQVMEALEEFERVIGVNYEITTDASKATFRLLKTESQEYGAYFFPQDPSFGADQGIGVFNVLSGGWSFDQQQSLERGGFSFAVILHEFGHAHGLAHPHDTGGGSEVMPGVTSASGTLGVFDLNQGVYTVMSYNDAWVKHPDGPSSYTGAGIDNGWSATLSAFDIAVLQRRYGANEVNTGDDTYQLADTVNGAFYQTILDSDGVDTIVYAGARNTQIDLTAATLDYSATGGGVVSFVRNAPGTPASQEIKGGYTIANGVVIENASGGSGNDVLIGNSAVNALTGNAGADILIGRDGVDTLRAGAGDDTLVGGAGADIVDGGDGFDTASFRDSAAAITLTVNSAGRATVNGDGVGDTFIGIEAYEGSNFADTLTGTSAHDTLSGLGGDDSISGGNGNDKLGGDAGNDRVDGGSGNDKLFGGTGVDTLIGGSGNDILVGGADADVLSGGSGYDVFTFITAADIGRPGEAHDTISDFAIGADKIDLSALFSSAEAQAGLAIRTDGNRMSLVGEETAYDISFYSEGGKTYVVGDTTGDGMADFSLELNGTLRLRSTNFITDQGDWDAFFSRFGQPVDYSALHSDVML